jgi:threonine/homoserine/homoserine lactone efflux protein
MMTLTTLLVFAGALFIAAGTPGPSVAALVARVISKGARDVLPFLFGMWAGDAIWLTCAIAGLSAIAESFYHVFVVIKWLGVLYLLYLAWRMWFAKADVEEEELPQERSRGRMFFTGLAIALGNPKIMMFYVAFCRRSSTFPRYRLPAGSNSSSRCSSFWLSSISAGCSLPQRRAVS